MIRGELTDQLLCGCAGEAGSALQEAPLALLDRPHETVSEAQTTGSPARQTIWKILLTHKISFIITHYHLLLYITLIIFFVSNAVLRCAD